MEGQNDVFSIFKPQFINAGRFLQSGQVGGKGVDHHVADEEDAVVADSGMTKIFAGQFGGSEEIVGDGVGYHAVDFFWHRQVVGTDAGFDVSNGDAELFGHDSASHRGGYVANNEHQVSRIGNQIALESGHNRSGLLGLSATTTAEVHIGLRNAQLFEEGAAHLLIIMLASVDQSIGH